MKLHNLKIKNDYWMHIYSGTKTFELRRNDRDFQVGDLIEFEVIDFKDCLVSGSEKVRPLYRITYVLKDVVEYGLDKDYCIFGIKPVWIKDKEEEKPEPIWNQPIIVPTNANRTDPTKDWDGRPIITCEVK